MSTGICCPHDSTTRTPECSACGCNAFAKKVEAPFGGKVGSRIILPFDEVRVDPGAKSHVTIRPYQDEGGLLLRRLVCVPRETQFVGLKVEDVIVGRSSIFGATGPVPIEFFAPLPEKLDQARCEAIEKSEFWENIAQAVVLSTQDITINYLNFTALTQYVSAVMYADEFKGEP